MFPMKRNIGGKVCEWSEFGVAVAFAGVAVTALIGDLHSGHIVDPVVIADSIGIANLGEREIAVRTVTTNDVYARCRASLSTRSFDLCGERVL